MRFIILITFLLAISACGSSTEPFPDENNDNEQEGAIIEAFPGLSFNRPLDIQNASDGTGRLFVVEQAGVISVFSNDADVEEAEEFLDIRSKVNDAGNEQGLLGLAFHPNFENNGYFYVNYTASGPDRTIISRYQVAGDDENQADAASESILLTYDQPYSNHNGGHLSFGPDGYLYIASGDGGSAGDPQNNAQDRSSLLGAILRVDVDDSQNGEEYGIPSGNPFAGNDEGYREEVFAYGLRNPWRFSFDAETGELWAGDVGQSSREAIHIVEKGLNYGWNIIEGSICYPPGSECSTDDLQFPVFEYNHDQGDRSITGGFVYRGSDIPELEGYYIYADFISGRIWALDISNIDNPENRQIFQTDFNISSFGVDQDNEIYITGFDGKIYRFGDDITDGL